MASGENGERNPFYGTGWDPIGSLNQSGHFGMDPNYSAVLDNQVIGSDLAHFPSDPGLISEMLPKISSFGSEMVDSFGGHSNFAQNSDEGVFGGSPNGKRKRKASVKNAEEEQQQDTCEVSKDDNENLEAKDKSNGVEVPSKENYIHVRAKRGQATNSHSLAERVRRERISERMRLLQELVPGCNKITGKAVMLDEIINYVQSLQQQVEFLSMKLATVNPEMNVDLQRILSKDILQLRGINSTTAPGNGLPFGSSHPFPGYPHGTFGNPPSTTTSFPPFLNNIWNNNEFQNIPQMGFDSDQPISNLGPNDMSKVGGVE